MPPGVFAVLLILGAFVVLYLVGKATPTTLPPSKDFPAYGKTLPDFRVETTDGKVFVMSDHKDKIVLLNFWATWCGPCRGEIPDLKKLQEKFGPKGFIVLGVSTDNPLEADRVKRFVEEMQFNYPAFMAPESLFSTIPPPSSLPTSYLVDRSGKVVAEFVGVDPMNTPEHKIGAEIEKLL
jgi:thiol-disulfide isomerase/thioredoxin